MEQAQRSIDIARSRKILLRDTLTYGHTVQSQIFDGDMIAKPDKSSLKKTLESSLIEDDYKVYKKIKPCVIIDFMSSIRKISFSKLSTFSDVFKSMWKSMTSVSKFDTIHRVYESYIDDSIKEAERIRRAKESDPLEYIDLSLQSPLPVQLDRFWARSRNKEKIQALSRKFLVTSQRCPTKSSD